VFYWCLSTFPCCIMLLFINASLMCFVDACQHFLSMFNYCSLALPWYVLLVFLDASLLCYVNVHQHFLITYLCSTPQVLLWPLVFFITSLLCILVVCHCLLVVFCWCSLDFHISNFPLHFFHASVTKDNFQPLFQLQGIFYFRKKLEFFLWRVFFSFF
jgi:hypothetical protein